MFGQAVEMLGNAWVYNGLPAPSGLDVAVSASSIAFVTNAYQESLDLDEAEEPQPVMLGKAYCELIGKILDTSHTRYSFKLM